MRLLFVIAVVIWCIVGDGSAQNRRPSSNVGYVLVFSDEFNQLDGSRRTQLSGVSLSGIVM